ncbi:MAG: FG-GAP-like repeat-containing protein [Terriglobales bacterium]
MIAPHLRGYPFFDPPETPTKSALHLHPHYRMATPLDPLVLFTGPGQDEFINEKYATQIAVILSDWSASLLRASHDTSAIEKSLLPNLVGTPFTPKSSQILRTGAIETHRNSFDRTIHFSRDKFVADLRSRLGEFSSIFVAEFQITAINSSGQFPEPSPPSTSELYTTNSKLVTSIRYELVGTSQDCYRKQRIGEWLILWEMPIQAEFRALLWQPIEETESRSTRRVYADIASAAFSSNASYSAQLQHGTDYWRTILDAACGIDIYGHNGISVGDIDNDGFDDLYICQPGGLPNRLYRNRGDGTFEDITQASGVGVIENTSCALFVDVNNDGCQDLIVVRNTGPLLFINDGNGRFHQQPDAFQFATPPQGTFTGAAVADYDRDGWLDIYFCLYIYYQGTSQYKYPSPYYDANNGPPNFLMRNNRNGTFRDVTAEARLNQNNTRYSFCCAWNDINGDGWPDLYVVNDFGRNNLYRNNGNGTFTDVAAEAGVEDIGAGMSVCWFDDEMVGEKKKDVEDLYIANMWTAAGERITMQSQFKPNSTAEVRAQYHKHVMGNSLFSTSSAVSANPAAKDFDSNASISSLHAATTRFADVTDLSQTRVGRWAWSSDAFDFDHDTHPDLYITNGMVSAPNRDDLNSFFWRQVVAKSPDDAKPSHDYEQGWSAINELIRADRTWSGFERNIFYANNGDGTFSDISGVAGLDFPEDGRAFAIADFDRDGRQEIFLKNRNAPQLRILKNVLPNLPPSIAFRLQGTKSNRDAIGAVIKIETEKGSQIRSVQAGSGFLSQHSKDVFFGLGGATGPVAATIRWPSGDVEKLDKLPINHCISIQEGAAARVRVEPFRTPANRDEPTSQEAVGVKPQPPETLPEIAETWLLAPIAAPQFSLEDSNGHQQSLSSLRGQPILLAFGAVGDERCSRFWIVLNQHYAAWSGRGFQLLAINVESDQSLRVFLHDHKLSYSVLQGSDAVAAVYNIIYRYLFDRHRDLTLPTCFLIDAKGDIVKIYQGPADPTHIEQDFRNIPQKPADRLARALPFPGVTEVVEFGRNYLSYGSVFFQRGYFDQAEAAFQAALRDDPESAEAVYGIGSVYLNQGKNSEAQKYFERALKMRATYPDTLANSWNNLGLIAGREGHLDDAVAYFHEALRLSPNHQIALNNLGSAYRQQKQWDEAKKIYARALALNPNDADANYGLGMVYAQQDDTARAFERLQEALKARPDYPEALNNLGILYLRTKRRDQAVASFERAIQAAPDFDQPYLNLARVYLIEENKEAARAVLQRLLTRNPNHPAALQMLSEIGRYD